MGWSISAAIALVVLAYIALPALIRYGLPQALARYGVVSSVEGARVNLASERVTLIGLQLGQAGGPEIRWGEVTARVDMAELLKGNIRIIDFQVKDARVDLARLRASEWNPPDRVSAIPELRKLNIDVGNVVLSDLEFIGLSEDVGQKVVLRSLSLGSLSHLEAGDRVAFQLQAMVGGAAVQLAGRARMVENLPVFEGRYEVSALELKGFGVLLGLATPGSVGGRVDGSGTFELQYEQGEGVIASQLSGQATINRFELEAGETRVTRTTLEWSGDSKVLWPVAGGPPRFNAGGTLSSPALEAARTVSQPPVGLLLRGMAWEGEIRRDNQFEMEGRLSGELLRIDATGQLSPRIEMELSGISAHSVYRAGGGNYEFNADRLSAENATLTQARELGRASATASRLLLHQINIANGDYAVGRLEAEVAEATEFEAASIKPSRSMRFIGIDAGGITLRPNGAALFERLGVTQASFEIGELTVDLSKARASNARTSARIPFEASAVSASSLRQKFGLFETWGSALRFSGANVSDSGQITAEEASAESLSQIRSGDPLWESRSVRAKGLSIKPDNLEAEILAAASFTHGSTGGEVIEIHQGEGIGFTLVYDSRVDARALVFGSMRYRGGQITTLNFDRGEIKAPGISFQGDLSARQLDAEGARHVDAEANVYQVEALTLGEISGHLASGLRIDAAQLTRLRRDHAAGPDYQADGLELSRIELLASGSASAVAGRLDALEISLEDGARLLLEDFSAARPVRTARARYGADGGRVKKLRYSRPGERVLDIFDIDVGTVSHDELGVHRLVSVNAAGIEADDPSAGRTLESGALQLSGIDFTPDGSVRADRAEVNAVFVRSASEDPSAAFSSARVILAGAELQRSGMLRIESVLVDGSVFTMGLDSKGEFVLPGLPFISADGEASGSLSVKRMETGKSARLNFFDRSTTPPFEITISPLQAKLEDFTSIDPARPATFTFDGSIDEFSRLKASGAFKMENDGVNLKVAGKVSAFELNRLNMYAAKHAKRAVQSGRGDAEFDIAVSGRKLSGNIQFVFSKVVFEPAPAETPGEGQNSDELSLQSSFAMLRDQDGVVRLTVPLSGSLDDPQFNFSDGLVQALIKTVRNTVMLTFKPLGLLVSAAGLIGGSQGLEFKPVVFDSGERTLSGEGLAHLDALARQLEQHPGVEVQICGRAVSADRIRIEQRRGEASSDAQPPTAGQESGSARVDQRMEKLARERASSVRQYLEAKKQISPQRLLECETVVETTPGRLPRVDLPVVVNKRSKTIATPKPSQ